MPSGGKSSILSPSFISFWLKCRTLNNLYSMGSHAVGSVRMDSLLLLQNTEGCLKMGKNTR